MNGEGAKRRARLSGSGPGHELTTAGCRRFFTLSHSFSLAVFSERGARTAHSLPLFVRFSRYALAFARFSLSVRSSERNGRERRGSGPDGQ